MKRKLFMLPLALLSALAISSCHEPMSHEKYEIPEEFDVNQEYNISFWAKNDNDQRQIKIYQDAIEDFNKYYPNVHIKVQNFTSYPDIHKEVLMTMGADATPNICIGYVDNVATYLESENSVVPLTDFFTDKNFGLSGKSVKYETIGEGNIIDSFLKEGWLYDEYYTIPFMRSTEALYINKTFVERLGKTIPEGDFVTWDWMWDVCRSAVEAKNNGTTITSQKGLTNSFKPLVYKSSDNWLIQYSKQKGIPYTNDDGDVLLFNNQTKEFLLDLKAKYNEGLYELFENSSHYPGDLINVWDAVFGIDSTAGATWIGYDRPNTEATSSDGCEKFETVLKCIPQVDVNNPKMISQGPSICVFNKTDKGEVLASWLFAQFLLTNDVQLKYQSTEGYLPVTKTAVNSDEFKNYLNGTGQINGSKIYSGAKQAKELLMRNSDSTFITSVFNGSADVRSAAKYMVRAVGKTSSSYSTSEGIDKLYSQTVKMNDLSDLMNKTNNTNPSKPSAEPVEVKHIGKEGIIILSSIFGVWVLIGVYVLYDKLKASYKIKSRKRY